MNIFNFFKRKKDNDLLRYRLSERYILAICLCENGFSDKEPMELFDEENFHNCWNQFEKMMRDAGYVK